MATTDFLCSELRERAGMPMSARTHAAKTRTEHARRDRDMTRRIDATLEDSFPASDPPSWTASVARLAPAGDVTVRARNADPIRPALQPAAALF
jgi:hypothetical protein